MSNFEFLKGKKEYALFGPGLRGSRKNLRLRSCYVCGRVPKSVGIGCEMGIFGGQYHEDALQG